MPGTNTNPFDYTRTESSRAAGVSSFQLGVVVDRDLDNDMLGVELRGGEEPDDPYPIAVPESESAPPTDSLVVVGSDDGERRFLAATVSTPTDASFGGGHPASVARTPSLNVGTEESGPGSIAYSDDGSKLFLVGLSGSVYEYSLSTAYDVSTASYSGTSFDVSSEMDVPWGLSFANGGGKMYVSNLASTVTVYEYTLSTDYDLSTASYSGNSFTISTIDDNNNSLTHLVVNDAGTKLFTVDSSDTVITFDFGTNYDVSTVEYHGALDISANTTTPTGASFNDDGSKAFVCGGNTTVVEYSLSTNYEPESGSHVNTLDVSGNVGVAYSVGFDSTGSTMFVLDGGSLQEYALSTNYDTTTASHTATHDISRISDRSRDFSFGDSGSNILVSDDSSGIFQYSLSSPYDLSTRSFEPLLGTKSNAPDSRGISFNDTGSKLFAVDHNNANIVEYSLSTSYDISSATHTSTTDISANSPNALDVAFSSSGGKMFIADPSAPDEIDEYTLSTDFDTSTASFVDSFHVDSETNVLSTVAFNNDGGKMFIGGSSQVYSYNLSTNYDVSTASYTGNSHFSAASPDGIKFADGGSVMFTLGDQDIGKDTLSSAYDLTTASNDSSAGLAVPDAGGLAFDGDDDRFYYSVVGGGVIRYNLSTAGDITTLSLNNRLGTDKDLGVAWGSSGDTIFATNSSLMWEYTLSTSYDINTATLGTSQDKYPFNLSYGPDIADGGSVLLLADHNGPHLYTMNLSTPNDISTETIRGVQDVGGRTPTAQSLAFDNDGDVAILLAGNPPTIFEYSLSSAYDLDSKTLDGTVQISGMRGSTGPDTAIFGDSGNIISVLHGGRTKVYEYSLSRSYDAETATISASVLNKDFTIVIDEDDDHVTTTIEQ